MAAGLARPDIPYADGDRNRLDLFLPRGAPSGLVVFVHGGFWLRLDKSYWSHLAYGAVSCGYAVAIPSYTLCPANRISGITREIGAAIERAADLVQGPIRLIGHSAGGHLASRMVTETSPLPPHVRERIAHTISVSGLHDLRPLMKTAMNNQLNIDEEEARRESSALLHPLPGTRITCWAGAAERSEFLRQNTLLANIWKGLGAETEVVEEPDRHHFNVLDGLLDSNHPLVARLMI
ncbi:acetyl esterase/lipase [Pseudorhizobium tarimense]|uniref:Acetyl esterase/lipase n=1 Tax=Pseudorhizobium tarimense TaxID=1079109 RepID=A0ABV2H8R9_9HYPH